MPKVKLAIHDRQPLKISLLNLFPWKSSLEMMCQFALSLLSVGGAGLRACKGRKSIRTDRPTCKFCIYPLCIIALHCFHSGKRQLSFQTASRQLAHAYAKKCVLRHQYESQLMHFGLLTPNHVPAHAHSWKHPRKPLS